MALTRGVLPVNCQGSMSQRALASCSKSMIPSFSRSRSKVFDSLPFHGYPTWNPSVRLRNLPYLVVFRCSNESVSVKDSHLLHTNESGKILSPEAARPDPIRTLLLDNYDSYTYNLFQLLSVINGVAPVVLRNDDITWNDLYRLLYEERAFHNVVISPGPGSPTCPSDVGICAQLLRECHDIPILGVCLGHQALCCVHGAQIRHAPEPVHGRLSEIEHRGHPLFANIPSGVNSGFKVVRYHSLIIDATTLPECLVPTAWTVAEGGVVGLEGWQDGFSPANSGLCREGLFVRQRGDSVGHPEGTLNTSTDGKRATQVLMGVSHRTWPHHGVQFHPESVATAYGKQILLNFQEMTSKFWEDQLCRPKPSTSGDSAALHSSRGQSCSPKDKGGLGEPSISMIYSGEPVRETKHSRLHWQKLPGLLSRAGGSRTLFCKLFAEEAVEDTFWLDSSTEEQGRARFSFMGGRGGPLWQRVTYHITHNSMCDTRGGVLKLENAAEQVREAVIRDGFLDFLNRELELRQCRAEDYAGLPFDFCGGFVGYLGYELKVECGAESNQQKSAMPDAGMFLADRVVVIDHSNDDVYVLALFEDENMSPSSETSTNFSEVSYPLNRDSSSSCPARLTENEEDLSFLGSLLPGSHGQSDRFIDGQTTLAEGTGDGKRREAEAWVEEVVRKVNKLARQDLHKASERMHHVSLVSSLRTTAENVQPPFVAEKSEIEYMKDVKRCQEFIRDGESYEVCLTTQFRRKIAKADCFGLYLTLRDTNPAPYSSWLHFGKDGPCICSSSPERFLQLDQKGVLEAKPIKGTTARGNTAVEDERLKYELQHSEKDQAENLMIVDLLRNDLGRVCEPGTVHVPSLMAVESYSTVHTMVSTVRGKKRSDMTAVDCVRAAFPGGSMTGAPKLRTMEIIDSLESSSRGVYSGSIGYFSFNSCFDLNIVIRTLVIHDDEASLGAGGAVIALSDPAAEYEEMLLKTKAPIRAVSKYENDSKVQNITDQRGPFVPLGL
ncbi:unnamed protein product [Calypogeia fissa]